MALMRMGFSRMSLDRADPESAHNAQNALIENTATDAHQQPHAFWACIENRVSRHFGQSFNRLTTP